MEADLHPHHVLQRLRSHSGGHGLLQHTKAGELQEAPNEGGASDTEEHQGAVGHLVHHLIQVLNVEARQSLDEHQPQQRLLRPENQGPQHSQGEIHRHLRLAEAEQPAHGRLVCFGDLRGPLLLRFHVRLLLVVAELVGLGAGLVLGALLAASLGAAGVVTGCARGRLRSMSRLLGGHQPVVLPLLLHERLVGAGLHHVPPLQHKDLIALTYGGQAVGDGDGGDLVFTPRIQRVQGGLDHFLALLIQG
mmetsp:Transcript_43007/g.103670  ORF Transcript_43007/g.103670 Transcript_43007/m.103670 type:complete len:248 (+) Transcript_43007:1640-2383(+)